MMKRKIVGILISCIVLCSLYYAFHATNVPRTGFASESRTEDSVFQNTTSKDRQNQYFTKTDFTWKDSKGDEYPVYMSHTGSCFVIKTSEQIRKELSKSDTRRDRYCLKNRTLKQ